jgi:hypothetical protein
MHLIGKSIKTWAVSNDLKEIPLIHIPKWDFHWQGVYMFPKIQRIPAGTFLYSEAVYDNTSANHHNPNDPPKEVRVGEATTDEMMITYFLFSQYLPGDENIIIDSVAASFTTTPLTSLHPLSKSISVTPNPSFSNKNVSVLFTPAVNEKVNMEVFDLRGRVIYTVDQEYKSSLQESLSIPAAPLTSGVYIIKLRGKDWIATAKWVVQ